MKSLVKSFLLLLTAVLVLSACKKEKEPVQLIVHVRGVKFETTVYHVSASVNAVMPTIPQPTVLPEDATNKSLKWSSSHENIIDIDAHTGAIKRTNKTLYQETTVTLTATSESGVYGKVNIILGEGEFDAVEEVIVLCKDEDENGYVDVSVASGAKMPVLDVKLLPETVKGKDVTWSSSNPEILDIDKTSGVLKLGSAASEMTTPMVVQITAKAGNGKSGTRLIIVGAADFNSFTFECEDTNWCYDPYSSHKASPFEYQAQGACKNSGQLWWNHQSGSLIGEYITVKFNNIFPAGTYTLDGYYCVANDFGVFDIYVNGKKVATDIDFCRSVLGDEQFTFTDIELKRGENEFKAVVKAASSIVTKAAMIGLDQFTIIKQ